MVQIKRKVVSTKKPLQKILDGRHLESPTVMRARICLRPGVALTKQSPASEKGAESHSQNFYKIRQNKKRIFIKKILKLNQRWCRFDSWVIFHNINYLGMRRMGGVMKKCIIDWPYWMAFFIKWGNLLLINLCYNVTNVYLSSNLRLLTPYIVMQVGPNKSLLFYPQSFMDIINILCVLDQYRGRRGTIFVIYNIWFTRRLLIHNTISLKENTVYKIASNKKKMQPPIIIERHWILLLPPCFHKS